MAAAVATYSEKINHFFPFAFEEIKATSIDRESAEQKTKQECDAILKRVSEKEFLVLFDESGKQPKSSIEFSKEFVRWQESGKSALVFVVGGPFGFNEEIRKRAHARISLSSLTMNHHVVLPVALEQIYRAIMIWKNRPYHNE